jgi:hypothetical protein
MAGNETGYDFEDHEYPADERPAQMSTPQIDGVSSPVSLVIPCDAEHVALCRLVAGALGVRDSLDEEAVADLKVIVTEACNCFLAMAAADHPAPGCSLRMDFDSRPGAFVVSLIYPERPRLLSWLEGCDPMSEAGLGLTILRALTDDIAELDATEEGLRSDGTILRLTKLLPA